MLTAPKRSQPPKTTKYQSALTIHVYQGRIASMKSMQESFILRAIDSSASIHTRQFLLLSEFRVSEKSLRKSSSCALTTSSRIAARFGFLNSANSSKDSNLRISLSAQSAVIFSFGRKEETSLQNSSSRSGVTTKTEFSLVNLLIFISPLARMSQQAPDSLMFVGLCTTGQQACTAKYVPLLSATNSGIRFNFWKDRFGSEPAPLEHRQGHRTAAV